MNVYNEIDPHAAQWLRNLGAETVLEKSIADVSPSEVAEANRFHTFAGIGLWEHALRLAGWPASVPVWTGSCPCQPFSVAGKRKGTNDERHLWPAWRDLIALARPPVIFGEQVASPDGRTWLDAVSADLEALGYAVGAADLCAAGVGAPHRRQRLFFVAYTNDARPQGRGFSGDGADQRAAGSSGVARGMADTDCERLEIKRLHLRKRGQESEMSEAAGGAPVGGLGHPDSERSGRNARTIPRAKAPSSGEGFQSGDISYRAEFTGATRGFWAGAEWVPCSDGKTRPTQPGLQQMADGYSESLGCIRTGTINQIEKEIADVNVCESDTREALRDLWALNATKAIQRQTRRCERIQEAPVLLAFMRELAREGWHLLDDLPSACWESAEEGLRALPRSTLEATRSPSRSRPKQQRANKSANALPIVSRIITRALERAWTMPGPLAHGSPGRVGKLRAYGNAIVPQVAATFIRTAMDVIF